MRDTGIGIPKEKLKLIFDAFRQADASTTREYGGTGLGLAISAELVFMMHGRIWVESEIGAGSTFHFTALYQRQAGAPTRADRLPPPDMTNTPVLVVESNRTNQKLLRELLESWRLRPTIAADIATARGATEATLAAGQPFQLVIATADLDGVDGFELAAELKRRLECPAIMLVTSVDRQGDAARCRVEGLEAHVLKPVRHSDLFDAIMTVSGVETIDHELRERLGEMTNARKDRCLRVLLAEDNVVNQKVAVALLKRRGHDVDIVMDGESAVKAVAANEYDVVLMDLQMPRIGGLQAAQIIKRDAPPGSPVPPIIAMTAHALKGDRERFLDAGMDGYVSKPITAESLFEEIDRLVVGVPRASAAGSGPGQHGNGSTGVSFDRAATVERLGGDEALFEELATLFGQDGPRLLDAIRAQYSARNMDDVARTAHTLKGAVGNFGATTVAEAAARLEAYCHSGDIQNGGAAVERLAGEVEQLLADLHATINHPPEDPSA